MRVPVICAPMAGVSGGVLAAAVSRAGGLGLVGGGYGDAAWLDRELLLAGEERIGVGFIAWALARQPELLDLALARKPCAVLFSFGDFSPFTARVKAAGAQVLAQVQTVEQARQAVAAGADALIAQGGEAGGHGGFRGTLALVPAVVDAVSPVPVFAAGGIADGRGLAAALLLGAAGVMCGSAFYVSEESLAHPAARQQAVVASGDDTIKGPVFDALRGLAWPEGPWSLRTLRNAVTDEWSEDSGRLRADLSAQQAKLKNAVANGNFEIAPVIVGEAADLLNSVQPASVIIRGMVDEASRLLSVPRTLQVG